MTSLTLQARALLDEDHIDDGPTPAARARMRQNIIGHVAASGAVVTASVLMAQSAAATNAAVATGAAANMKVAAATAVTAATFGGVTASKLLLGAALLGALGVGVWRTTAPASGDSDDAAATALVAVVPAPNAATHSDVAAAAKAAVDAVPVAEPRPPAHSPPSSNRDEPFAVVAAPTTLDAQPPSAVTTATSLDAQTALLMRARRAVREGRHSRALALLAEYSRRYGDGALAEERSALQVMALCKQGRPGTASEADVAAGLQAAERFRHQFPRSPLRSHVEQACRKP